MKKIPTLFLRDQTDPRYVTRTVHPDCGWVMDGEGVPTRKYDGTCTMFDGQRWWARREVKPGKYPPPNFVSIEFDGVTNKTVGWEPIEQSAFAKYHAETSDGYDEPWPVGTYELVGPKINGNPEHLDRHRLLLHETAEVIPLANATLTFEGVRSAVIAAHEMEGCEGIVWHHQDGRMAKLKRRDFPSLFPDDHADR